MATLPITKRGADKLKAELHQLKAFERPAVINAIAEARALRAGIEGEAAVARLKAETRLFELVQERRHSITEAEMLRDFERFSSDPRYNAMSRKPWTSLFWAGAKVAGGAAAAMAAPVCSRMTSRDLPCSCALTVS